jgi:flagellar biosynthesis GTPase FlhF
MKLAANAMAGLFALLIQKKPFKKYLVLSINQQGVVCQHIIKHFYLLQ